MDTFQSMLSTAQQSTTLESSIATRITSIDITRAITMVLMIFVNDLWSLTNIPAWLLHTTAEEDGMGLSDAVFPAFVFIVGMSIPFAINNRRKKGDDNLEIVVHILARGIALLVMGVFLVNGEQIHAEASGLSRFAYNTLVCTSFILIWNAYPSSAKKTLVWGARIIGGIILLVLAFKVRGTKDALTFNPYWWGILGLIGWCYLVCSLIYTFLGRSFRAIVISWLIMILLSMLAMEGLVSFGFLSFMMDPLSNGSLPFLTMGGIIISMIYLHFRKNQWPQSKMLLIFAAIAIALFAAGLYANRFWIIAKLGATPPWVMICSGITIVTFAFVYWLADIKKKANWFEFIKPAGTNTLLTYLIPYFAYPVVSWLGIHWPAFMLTGGVGLIKSFLFALLCVFISGLLAKRGIQLKL